MRNTLLMSALLLSLAGAQSTRPDIVLVMADDMGYSDIGCYGGEIRTPNIDSLAAGGLRFTQFYNTGRCCPTRAALMTGLYSHQAGVGHMTNDRGWDGYRGDLNRQCRTIAEVLGPAGYRCYMSGKWHLTKFVGPQGPKDNWPIQRGFHRFFGTIHGGGSFFDPNSLTRGNTRIAASQSGFYYTDAISDAAVEFIGDHVRAGKEEPMFLYVAYTAPHWPMHALPEDIDRYKGRYDDGWDALRQQRRERMVKMGLVSDDWPLSPRDKGIPDWNSLKDKDWFARRMEVYAAMVDRLDQGVGRIVGALKKAGRLENTLILFLADNGGCAEEMGSLGKKKVANGGSKEKVPPARGEPQLNMIPRWTRDGKPVMAGRGVMPGPADTYLAYGKPWANASNTPFRLYKHYVHEGGISTPLVAHWPRTITRHGAFERQPGHLVDIMATCVDVARADYPAEADGSPIHPLEGRSLIPAFGDGRIMREALYWEHEGNRAVRRGDWKLVARGARGPWELYDLSRDRTELDDLAGAKPELVEELAGLWQAWAERAHVLPLNPTPPEDLSRFNLATSFRLDSTATLSRFKGPYLKKKGFTVKARVDHGQGVVVAQGGGTHGFALYVDDKGPALAIRRGGRLSVVRASASLPRTGSSEIEVRVGAGGRVRFLVGGKKAGGGPGGGLLVSQPVDGLEVGQDAGGAVGEYRVPSAYSGRVYGVEIRIQ